jgi:transcriptional regulator with XRE-family HTH domain
LTLESIIDKLICMSIVASSLLQQVITTAKAAGLDQRALARAADIKPETISRAKKRGSLDLETLAAIAKASGLVLGLQPATASTPEQPVRHSALADPAWGLAWSNPSASAEALVRNALIRGGYAAVLQAVLEHGIDFVRTQWAQVVRGEEGVTSKSKENIRRMLSNIEKGMADAAA